MKKYSILLLLLVLACCGLYAQSPQGWTLRECIEHAIENNISVRRTALGTEQSKIEKSTAKWSRLPNLSASARHNYSWGRTASPIDNTYTNTNNMTTSFDLSTSIPLFTGLELPNQYELSKLNLKAAIEDLNKAKEDIAINVTSAYLQVLFNLEISKVAQEQVRLSKEQNARMQALADVGKASPAEVAETRARVAQEEMSAVNADNAYKLSLLDLTQLLEIPSPEGFTIQPPAEEPEFEHLVAPEIIYNQASMSKPGILAAQYRLDGSQKSIRIAQSAYYPQLNFNAGLGSNYYRLNGVSDGSFFDQMDNHLNKYLGFSLSIPIFNRFRTRNNVRLARIQQIDYSLRLDDAKKALYKEIQQAWYNAIAAETRYNTSLIAVEANEASFRLMREKFENGQATFLEFNESRTNMSKAVSDQIQAKYDYIFMTKILDFYKGQPLW